MAIFKGMQGTAIEASMMEDQDADYIIQNESNSIMNDGFNDRAGVCDKASRGLRVTGSPVLFHPRRGFSPAWME